MESFFNTAKSAWKSVTHTFQAALFGEKRAAVIDTAFDELYKGNIKSSAAISWEVSKENFKDVFHGLPHVRQSILEHMGSHDVEVPSVPKKPAVKQK